MVLIEPERSSAIQCNIRHELGFERKIIIVCKIWGGELDNCVLLAAETQ